MTTITNFISNFTVDQFIALIIGIVLLTAALKVLKEASRIVLSIVSVLSLLHTFFPSLYITILTKLGDIITGLLG